MRKAKTKGYEAVEGFEWPVCGNETQRIKENTRKYAGLTISEAFAKEYKLRLKQKEDAVCNTFSDVEPGDIVPLRILSINRKGVVFDNASYKDEIVCTVNLYQYEKLREFLPVKPVRCKVVKKTAGKIYVDPFDCMLNDWLSVNVDGRKNQYDLSDMPRTVRVCGLKRLNGGYTGRVRVDTVSDFTGQDMWVQAFIPGSHIVLNIEQDFEQWEGHDVDAFISNYVNKPGSLSEKSLICSRKNYLTFMGQKNLIWMFNNYTEGNENWDEIRKRHMYGNVTGVIHSAKKCGVFVEIPELYITGMVEVAPDELTKYHKGSPIEVKMLRFDETKKYNPLADQMQHVLPYEFHTDERGHKILDRFNLKPVFELA